MDYREAVQLAKVGDERGFHFLYEETYKSKYYLALQYMKSEEMAKDVLQEAYIKAFSKLDMLKKPEAFSSWLGMIVGNTAKNMLKKNIPMLFSDIAVDGEESRVEYQLEDEKTENQPEIAYTRKETKELVHELMETLSEEQRICMLMFHIEGLKISEIATTLNCSENTVKSRLNYGKKNLKVKAEELHKKGYKLYSIAPLPLLLHLLRTEEANLFENGILEVTGEQMLQQILHSFTGTESISVFSSVKKAADAGAKAVSKSGVNSFIHTMTGKIIVAVVGLSIVGGTTLYGVSQLNNKGKQPESAESSTSMQEEVKTEESHDSQGLSAPREIKDDEYSVLIAGNLTKSELEYVLAHGPQEIGEQGLQDSDYHMILNRICENSAKYRNMIAYYGVDMNWRSQYSVVDVNRLFSAFTTHQFTEENDEDTAYGIDVKEDKIIFYPASGYMAKAMITSTEYTDEQMVVFFTYDYASGDGKTSYIVDKRAVLEPVENGKYRIVRIEVIEEVTNPEESEQSSQVQTEELPTEETSSFPIGTYSYVAQVGGMRASMTIDDSGFVIMKSISSGSGEIYESSYQIVVDNTVSVSDDIITYQFQSLDGNSSFNLSYNVNTQTLKDIDVTADGVEWVKTE